MTLFVPCAANLLMIIKERGLKVGLAILAFVTMVPVAPVAPWTPGGLRCRWRLPGLRRLDQALTLR